MIPRPVTIACALIAFIIGACGGYVVGLGQALAVHRPLSIQAVDGEIEACSFDNGLTWVPARTDGSCSTADAKARR